MYSLISFPESSTQSSHASPLCAKVARAVKAEDIPAPECECIKGRHPQRRVRILRQSFDQEEIIEGVWPIKSFPLWAGTSANGL